MLACLEVELPKQDQKAMLSEVTITHGGLSFVKYIQAIKGFAFSEKEGWRFESKGNEQLSKQSLSECSANGPVLSRRAFSTHLTAEDLQNIQRKTQTLQPDVFSTKSKRPAS